MSDKNVRPLLSICIPTYNQPQELDKTLNSLVGQDLSEVMIVIKDDNPNDLTLKVVEKYKNQIPIQYFRGEKNGVDRAFLFLSENADSEYIWWFGDDIFLPNTLNRIVSTLKTHPQIDFMYINSMDIEKKYYSFNVSDSFFFKSGEDALMTLTDQLGFCSALLFKKAILLRGLEESKKFIGTSWVTLFLAVNSLTYAEKMYFMHGQNFISLPKDTGEVRWYDPFIVHGINFYIVIWSFKNKFNQTKLRHLLKEKFARTWRAVIIARALGYKSGFASNSPKILKMAQCYWTYPEFYIALPMMLMPSFLLKFFYKIFRESKSCAE